VVDKRIQRVKLEQNLNKNESTRDDWRKFVGLPKLIVRKSLFIQEAFTWYLFWNDGIHWKLSFVTIEIKDVEYIYFLLPYTNIHLLPLLYTKWHMLLLPSILLYTLTLTLTPPATHITNTLCLHTDYSFYLKSFTEMK